MITDKTYMKKLHEINSMVIKLIKKNYTSQANDELSTEHFWYDVIINTDGSLNLGFQAHIINNNTDKTYIKCNGDEDLETVKTMLNKRLNQ